MSPVSPNPMTLEEFLDHVCAVVSDYFEEHPDERSAEVQVPSYIVASQQEELEELLPWILDDLREAGVEDECTVSYDERFRVIVVRRNSPREN